MAPTIIVGDDESAGDVAARLLDLADHQRQVKVRTDLPGAAFEVPDSVYDQYVGKSKRSDDERRTNAFAKRQADDDTGRVVTSDDELPPEVLNADPDSIDPEQVGTITSDDELPAGARNIDPPANGDQGDSGDQPPADDQPAPRKRTSRARKTAAARATGSGK